MEAHLGAVEAHNGAIEAHNGAVEAYNVLLRLTTEPLSSRTGSGFSSYTNFFATFGFIFGS
jgi:hypothetical protein